MYTKCERLSVRVNDWTSVIAQGIPNQEGSRLTRLACTRDRYKGGFPHGTYLRVGQGGSLLKMSE